MEVGQRKAKLVSSVSPLLIGLFHMPTFACMTCSSPPRSLSSFIEWETKKTDLLWDHKQNVTLTGPQIPYRKQRGWLIYPLESLQL